MSSLETSLAAYLGAAPGRLNKDWISEEISAILFGSKSRRRGGGDVDDEEDLDRRSRF